MAGQLGREPITFRVAARCPYGRPSVIENERRREMPTTFWITCPSLQAAISRVEAGGGVRQAQEDLGTKVVDEVHTEHLRLYGTRVAGVGGPEGEDPERTPIGRIKCLHAFTALHLAGALPNLVAGWTLSRIEEMPYPDPTRCPECAGHPEHSG